MKNIKYILLILLLPLSLGATELKCSKNGTAILYVNGIDNTEADAIEGSDFVTIISETNQIELDKDNDNHSTLYHGYHYNRSQGIGLDIIETAAQIIRSYLPKGLNPYKEWSKWLRLGTLPEEIKNPDVKAALKIALTEVISNVSQLSPVAQDTIILAQKIGGYLDINRKVILVSHSQGNLFSSEAYSVLQSFISEDKLKFYKNLMVATPANYNATGGTWMTLDSDRVIKGVVDLGLPSNFQAIDDSALALFKEADSRVHNFIDIYLGSNLMAKSISSNPSFPTGESFSMLNIFTTNLIDTAKSLESNCGDQFRVTAINPTGGVQPYLYNWYTENGDFFSFLNPIEVLAGNYKICMSDSANSGFRCKEFTVADSICSVTGSSGRTDINYQLACEKVVSPPPPPPSSSDFRLTITSISPFNPPFVYTWSTGDMLNMIQVPAGIYQACVTDGFDETRCKEVEVGDSLCRVVSDTGSTNLNFNVVCESLTDTVPLM